MLDGIMNLASRNATIQFESLEKVGQDIANLNTSGYKALRFEQYINPYGELQGTTREDYSQGSIMITNRPLDVAIDGAGMIPVTQPDGTMAYTRDGSMAINSQGFLVTNRGDLVGSGIQVPPDYQRISIDRQGQVSVFTTNRGAVPMIAGKIETVKFTNPEGLKHIGDNKVVATPDSGEPLEDKDSKIKQGNLERANVSVMAQVDLMLRLNASIISNLRVVKFSDDIYRQAANLRQ